MAALTAVEFFNTVHLMKVVKPKEHCDHANVFNVYLFLALKYGSSEWHSQI